VSLAHVGFGLKSGDSQLNLMNLLADILTCEFTKFDFQAVELKQNICRAILIFLTINESK
jgi:hypothetical protein